MFFTLILENSSSECISTIMTVYSRIDYFALRKAPFRLKEIISVAASHRITSNTLSHSFRLLFDRKSSALL